MLGLELQALSIGLGLSILAFIVGRVVLFMGEQSLDKKYGVKGVRQKLVACARLEGALEQRKNEHARRLKDADGQASDALRRKKQLERRIDDAVSAGEALVRLIGDEIKDAPCFYAEVNNKYVGTANFEQKQHAYIDPSWAQPQVIEVWARSAAEARAEIERRYPPAFGYNISRLLDIGSVDSMKPGGRG